MDQQTIIAETLDTCVQKLSWIIKEFVEIVTQFELQFHSTR